MSIAVSVVNQKGGVGKTTTTVNLGSALAKRGRKVLLIDMDPQSHTSEHLGVQHTETQNVLSVLEEKTDVKSAIVPSYVKNLWVLPASLKLGQFNQNSPAGMQFALRSALEKCKDQFDYIFIDCQPSLSLLTLNALTACDHVLLPVQAEFLALDGLTQLIMTLRETQTKLHPKLHVLGVVLTMFDKRNRLSFEVQTELKKNFGNDLFDTAIPRSVKLAEAPSFAKSVLDYASDSAGAKAYKELAQEVEKKLKPFRK